MGSKDYYSEYNGVKYVYNGFHGMTLKLTQDIKHIKVLGSVEDIYGHKFDIEIISAETFINSNIESVSIEENIREIGWKAFKECNHLTFVKCPSSLDTIKDYAFAYCQSLKKIEFPKSLKSIESNCFRNNISLYEISFNEGLSEIDEYAFEDCTSLVKIEIPQSVKRIGYKAFKGCIGLEEIVIHSPNIELAPECFADCTSLKIIKKDNSLVLKEECFIGCTNLDDKTYSELEKTEVANKIKEERANVELEKKERKKEDIKFSIKLGLALIACIPLLIIGYVIFAYVASYILGAMAICGAIVLGVIILGSLFNCNISDDSLKTIEKIGFIIGLLICACLILNRC